MTAYFQICESHHVCPLWVIWRVAERVQSQSDSSKGSTDLILPLTMASAHSDSPGGSITGFKIKLKRCLQLPYFSGRRQCFDFPRSVDYVTEHPACKKRTCCSCSETSTFVSIGRVWSKSTKEGWINKSRVFACCARCQWRARVCTHVSWTQRGFCWQRSVPAGHLGL